MDLLPHQKQILGIKEPHKCRLCHGPGNSTEPILVENGQILLYNACKCCYGSGYLSDKYYFKSLKTDKTRLKIIHAEALHAALYLNTKMRKIITSKEIIYEVDSV